jgi:hypothetical protein
VADALLLFSAFSLGGACGCVLPELIRKLNRKLDAAARDDPSVAERIRLAQLPPSVIELTDGGPIPIRSIEWDRERGGVIVTESSGKVYYTRSGVVWHSLPLFDAVPGQAQQLLEQVLTQTLMRAKLDTLVGTALKHELDQRGGKVTFISAQTSEQFEQSALPYR